MKTTALRRSAAPVALAATLLAAFLVLFSPLSASAHDALVSSSPAADSSVDVLPAELTLTFSAKLIEGEGATEVVVTDPEGNTVTDGPATVDGAVVTQPLVSSAPAGQYHVIWKVVSSDGHPTSDEYYFTVTTGSEAAPSEQPSAAPTSAAPSEAASEAPDATTTPAPDADAGSGSTTWIWVVSIVGILIIVALVVWLSVRGRRSGPDADSDPSPER
ncbi:copper resistance CopC family protein [Microbacterium sp. EST19A]|uniref:copper resistance CopC family protein n=1 Tax=Microbacterium sp. EST19A TaxID=2862681 RepID=UPI001CBB3C94|nr:copper resistance CopC family protein [Microbacterium sp. EST19A]